MAALTMTEERETKVVFSEPYFLTRPQLMIRLDYNATKLKILARRGEIAVVRGSHRS